MASQQFNVLGQDRGARNSCYVFTPVRDLHVEPETVDTAGGGLLHSVQDWCGCMPFVTGLREMDHQYSLAFAATACLALSDSKADLVQHEA
jgi:hypothetical protein